MYPQASKQGGQKRTYGNVKLKPLKGAFLPLTESIHEFLFKATADIGNCFSDSRAENEPEKIIGDLVKGTFDDPSGLEWKYEEDEFGFKAYASRPYDPGPTIHDGELRVTVVIKKKDGTINIDIRAWGIY